MQPEQEKYKYEYQGQEHQTELGLNWSSFKYRNYDYAIGRFMSVDPLAGEFPYNSAYAFQENKMGLGRELEGLELKKFEYESIVSNQTLYTQSYRIEYTTYKLKTVGYGPFTEEESNQTQVEVSVFERKYDLNGGKKLPNNIDTDNGIVNIYFGKGFASDNYHTPDNKINQVAVEGSIEGVKIANNKYLADIKSLTINATTNANHGNVHKADWNTKASNHYIPAGVRAIDIGKINGKKPNVDNCETQRLQQAMNEVPTIHENFGPTLKTKDLNPTPKVRGHNTWIHVSFR